MRTVGLTGGIGSGKSTAAGFLAGLGAAVVDLDRIGHEVLKQPEIREKLAGELGKDILDDNGEIDRARLGRKVFSDRQALSKLNAIVHPAIDKVVGEQAGEYRRRGVKVVVFEAAALLEAGRDRQFDEIWVTAAPEAAVLKRLSGRPGLTEADAKARLRSQITDEERTGLADVVIANDGTLEELRQKVELEWEKLQERLGERGDARI